MASLMTRVLLENVRGGTIGYFYSREIISQIFPPMTAATNSSQVRIGTIVNFEEHNYVVRNIIITLFPEQYGNDNEFGVALHNVDEITPYDMTIALIVERE